MIEEQQIDLDINSKNIISIILKDGFINLEKLGIKIYYYGDNSFLENFLNKSNNDKDNENDKKIFQDHKDLKNNYFFGKYKDIYIGGLSVFNMNSRERFGLNKYNEENQSFYIGFWKNNLKEGIGYLKVDQNHMYIGNFKNNQFNGKGLGMNGEIGNLFFGDFIDSKFQKGLYFNADKNTMYIGSFLDNKKNDDFCLLFAFSEGYMILGEIKNDLFIKGYVCFFIFNEEGGEISFQIEKVAYYDNNDNKEKIVFGEKKLDKDFLKKLIDMINDMANNIMTVKIEMENVTSYFDFLEGIYSDQEYNIRIGRYKDFENNFCLSNDFLEVYEEYFTRFNDLLQQTNLDEIQREFEHPKLKE